MTATIPVTVIGGYLGAGKTTLINRVLTGSHGRRLAVLVNDFGSLNIDVGLIAGHHGNTYALTNGCVCCSVGDDLSTTLREISYAANPPDEILIEASGVAEGSKFEAHIGSWLGLSLRGLIVLADAETIQSRAKDKFVGDLVVRQLKAADLIVINKSDLVGVPHLQELGQWFKQSGFAAPVITTTQGALPPEFMFSNLAPVGTEDQHDHADHNAMFDTTVVTDDKPWDRKRLETALDNLPPGVVRVKGRVLITGETTAGLVQLVGRRWSIEPAEIRPQQTELVIIGVRNEVDPAVVTAALLL